MITGRDNERNGDPTKRSEIDICILGRKTQIVNRNDADFWERAGPASESRTRTRRGVRFAQEDEKTTRKIRIVKTKDKEKEQHVFCDVAA